MKAFLKATSSVWAITDEMLEAIIEISSRDNDTIEAVAAKLGRPLDNTYNVELRNGIAILPVTGPLIRYANIFSRISGATSYEMLARDFTKSINDPNVQGIIFSIDSPGGEVNGVSDLAELISKTSTDKPVWAYIGGSGASGAYWIASQADMIYASDTALVGSVGVVYSTYDTTTQDEQAGRKRVTLVSSQSPNKALGVDTSEGRKQLQVVMDDTAEVFISKVAEGRGITPQQVLDNYGQGKVFVGQRALKQGLIDGVSTFEDTFSAMLRKIEGADAVPALAASKELPAVGGHVSSESEKGEKIMSEVATSPAPEQVKTIDRAYLNANHPTLVEEIRTEERARIQGIVGHESFEGREKLGKHLAFATDQSIDSAVSLLELSAKEAPVSTTASFSAVDEALKALSPEVGANVETDAETDELDAILKIGASMGLMK